MIRVTVNINGMHYNLTGEKDEKYLQGVANFVDGRIKEIMSKKAGLSTTAATVLAAVNIADELYECDLELDKSVEAKNGIIDENNSDVLAAPGSVLVFTYVDAGVLDGSVTFPEAERWVRNVERAGEPWTFGVVPSTAPAFLRARGFDLVIDVSTRDADGGRFAALGRRDRGSDLYHVVVAEAA